MREEHIDMSRLQQGAPLLASHDSSSLDSVIGVVERAWIEGDLGKAIVRFSNDPDADKVFQKVKEGILRNVSVGYAVRKYEDITGTEDKTPTYRAINWEPHELSIVSIPFDKNAQIRNLETNFTEVEIVSTQKDKMNENEKPNEAAVLAERNRIKEIRRMGKTANLNSSIFIENLIERGVESDVAGKMILAEMERTQVTNINNSVSNIEVGEENHNSRRSVLENAIIHRLAPQHFGVSKDSELLYGRRILQQIEYYIPRNTMESEAAYCQRVMTTSDLPQILANSATKSMQKSYELAPKSHLRWTNKKTVRDFKEASFHQVSDFPSLKKKNEMGEIEDGYISEKQETAKVDSYGRIVGFSEESLVNDDLGALQKFSNSAGLIAARLDNQLAYLALTTNKTMKDGVTLYHASHNNLASPAAAISETTISAAFKAMMKQRSVDDLDNLNLIPKFLICGPDQLVDAKKAVAAINATQTSNVNVFSGQLEVVCDAELSGNQYYFACDNNLLDTVSLIRIEGKESPEATSKIDFRTGALLFKTSYAVAAAPLDWRGLYKNAGN